MKYVVTIEKIFKVTFTGKSRTYNLNEPVRMYVDEVTTEHLSAVIDSIDSQGWTVIEVRTR